MRGNLQRIDASVFAAECDRHVLGVGRHSRVASAADVLAFVVALDRMDACACQPDQNLQQHLLKFLFVCFFDRRSVSKYKDFCKQPRSVNLVSRVPCMKPLINYFSDALNTE